MWFSLFVVVLVLTITFFQGLQGLFTALINFLLAVLAAALAFGFYESLYFSYLIAYQPEQGRAIALMAIFIVTLLVMRTIFDLTIKQNVHFPVYVDRAGGGVFGLLTALIIVGMLAISVQLLPFGRSFLGFSRYVPYDETEQPVQPPDDKPMSDYLARLDYSQVKLRRQNLWLKPDAFTLALVSHLSDYALQGRARWSEVYPDLLRTIGHVNAFPYAAARFTAPPDALRIDGVWNLPDSSLYVRETVTEGRQNERTIQLKPDSTILQPTDRQILIRVHLSTEAADTDRVYRFATGQFRLLARDSQSDKVSEHLPVGINYALADRWVRIYPGEPFFREDPGGGLDLDLVFEVPEQARLWFLEYKLNARAAVPAVQDTSAPAPLAPGDAEQSKQRSPRRQASPPAAQTPPPSPSQERPRDRVSGVRVTEAGSFFSDELPFELTDYSTTGDVEIASDRIVGGAGRLIAPLDDEDQPTPGNRPPLGRFDVPEGSRLLHLQVNQLDPQSWLASRSLGAVRRQIPRYYLVDAADNNHLPVGLYAIATTPDGRRILELVYFDKLTQAGDKPPQLDRIRLQDLTGNYALYYLYQLPPGTRVQGFNTGRRVESLAQLDLVAPQ